MDRSNDAAQPTPVRGAQRVDGPFLRDLAALPLRVQAEQSVQHL
jgi:hypothetical protein